MGLARFCPFVLGILLAVPSTIAQEAPPRDARAVAVLQQSSAAMGRGIPTDVVAEGSVTIVAGSKTDRGRIRCQIRGWEESSEKIETSESVTELRFSRGLAAEVKDAKIRQVSQERAATSQSPLFPQQILAAALNAPDGAFEYVGPEKIGNVETVHIRFWRTFASLPKFQRLAEFTRKDVWIDAQSGLPVKLAYEIREASGRADRIPFEVTYSDYRSVGGVAFPFRIEELLNGTPWTTITLDRISLNTGLSDAAFFIR